MAPPVPLKETRLGFLGAAAEAPESSAAVKPALLGTRLQQEQEQDQHQGQEQQQEQEEEEWRGL